MNTNTRTAILSITLMGVIFLSSCGSSGGGGSSATTTSSVDATGSITGINNGDTLWKRPGSLYNIYYNVSGPAPIECRWTATVGSTVTETINDTLIVGQNAGNIPLLSGIEAAFPSAFVTVAMSLDPANKIAESNESNNLITRTFLVRQDYSGSYAGTVASDPTQSVTFDVANHVTISGTLKGKHVNAQWYSDLEVVIPLNGDIGTNGKIITTGSDEVTPSRDYKYVRSWTATVSMAVDGTMSADLDFTVRCIGMPNVSWGPTTTHRHYTQTSPALAPRAFQ